MQNNFFYKAVIILFFVFSCIQKSTAQCTWSSIGLTDFNQPSYQQGYNPTIEVDNNDVPYIAFSDPGLGNKITVKKYVGNTWINVGNPAVSNNQGYDARLSFDAFNTPYVVFSDVANGQKPTVMKFNGTAWVIVGNAGFSIGQADYISMAFDNSGVLYVACKDYGVSGKANVMKFNGTSWVNVGTPGISMGQADYVSFDFDNSGTPFVAYSDLANGQAATVMKFNGTTWTAVGNIGFSLWQAEYTDICVDAAGAPYVVYRDHLNTDYATVMKYNGISWVSYGTAISPSIVDNTTMAMHSNGDIYIAFTTSQSGKISVMKCSNFSWTTVGNSDFSLGYSGEPSIALNSLGIPYAAYNDASLGSKACVNMFNGTNWQNIGNIGFSEGGVAYTAIAMDNTNTPYVAFKDFKNGNKATLMKYNGTSWLNVGVPGFSQPGADQINLSIDNSNAPYVAYKDGSNGSKASVMKYNGTSWNYVGGAGCTPGAINDLSMVLDNSGTPYIAFSDAANASAASVMKFNGTSWAYVGSAGFSPGVANHVFITKGPADTLYVIYQDAANSSALSVKKYNGTAWVSVGGFLSAFGGIFPSIAVDANGTVYAAYVSNFSGDVVALKFNGTGWVPVGVQPFSLGSATLCKMVLDNNGLPCVMFVDAAYGNKLRVTRFDGINWMDAGSPGFTAGSVDFNSIAIDNNGILFVAYASGGAFAKKIGLITTTSVYSSTVCVGENVLLNASGGVSYNWSGPAAFSSTLASPTVSNISIPQAGVYTVTISDPFCGISINQINLVVNSLPAPTITVNSGTICSGQSFTINASGANTYTFQGGNAIVNPTVNSTYTVIGTGANGCISQSNAIASISVNTTPTLSVNSGTICQGNTFTITPGGAFSYTIQGGNAIVSPLVNTTYTVSGTDVNGCVSQALVTANVSVTPNPTISASNGTVCLGYSFLISPNGANTYTFQGGNAVVTPTANTSYTVIGSTFNGCLSQASATVYLTVNPNPTVTVNSGSICSGESFTIIPAGANTYTIVGAPNIISPTTSTMYTVFGVDLNGCTNTATTSITVFTTCVWPGDANSDGTADNLDILELGLHYNQAGAARALISNLWQSYTAGDWVGLITNGKNLKHSDCNGDGVINLNDTLAIYSNYNLTHAFKSNGSISSQQLNIVPDQAILVNGQWGTASVYLGDPANTINNINGIAFTISYDHTLLEQDSVWLEYHTSFLDPTNTNLNFRKNNFSNDVLYTATTHTNNINVSGNGKIAALHYKISSSLTATNVLNFNLSQINQSNASGVITPLTGNSGSITITNDVGIIEYGFNENIFIMPNPTSDLLNIKFENFVDKQAVCVELINVLGQVVLSSKIDQPSFALSLRDLAAGIYYLRVDKSKSIKIIKE